MSQRTRAVSPQLRAFKMLRLLDVLIDAWADHNWGLWETALLAESSEHEGWNEDESMRVLRKWGARDQHGVYAAAGLTKAETEVAFLHFDRQLDSAEIGRLLNRSAITVRVQLHKAQERLRRLSWTEAA